jgi:hypothetical protein
LDDPLFVYRIARKKEFHDTAADGRILPIEEQADTLCNQKPTFSPHQTFVRRFLSPETPYRNLLLYHGVGTGKTCSAIGLAEETRQFMKRSGKKSKIMVVAPSLLLDNFRRQLFDESQLSQDPATLQWNLPSCVGPALLEEIMASPTWSMETLQKADLVRRIHSLVKASYVFLEYTQFANVCRMALNRNKPPGATESADEQAHRERQNIERVFHNVLLIIDEIQNINEYLRDPALPVSPDKPGEGAKEREREREREQEQVPLPNAPPSSVELHEVGAVLMRVVQYTRTLRILGLSATPMVHSPAEIVWLANLFNANDKRPLLSVADVFTETGNFREAQPENGIEGGEEMLRRKLRGYVSFVRGENPYTFPFRLYPSLFAPENSLQHSQSANAPLLDLFVTTVVDPRDSYQMQVYAATKERFLRTHPHVGDWASYEGWTPLELRDLQPCVDALTVAFPSPAMDQWLVEGGEDVGALNSALQLASVVTSKRTQVASKLQKEPPLTLRHQFQYRSAVLQTHGRVFSPDLLPRYSARMTAICQHIRDSEGIVLVYADSVEHGVLPMALALEEMGFTRCSRALGYDQRTLFRQPAAKEVDSTTMRTQADHLRDNLPTFHPARYMMITEDPQLSPSNELDVELASSASNRDGTKARVILLSSVGVEGLDFKNVRQIHVLHTSSGVSVNQLEQVIGRGVRNLSHCGLPFSKRNVQIYLHTTHVGDGDGDGYENGNEGEELADRVVYRLAERKAVQMGRVTRLLKENAADCQLNLAQSHWTADRLNQEVANQSIRLQLSSLLRSSTLPSSFAKEEIRVPREVDFRAGDLDGSNLCDYMTCAYQCRPPSDGSAKKGKQEDLDWSTYSSRYVHDDVREIAETIQDLFKEREAYRFAEIVAAVNHLQVHPLEEIVYALSLFSSPRSSLDGRGPLRNREGVAGHLVTRGGLYVFQPALASNDPGRSSNVVLFSQPKERDLAPAIEDADFEALSPYHRLIVRIAECVQTVWSTHPRVSLGETNWYKHMSCVLNHLRVVYGFSRMHLLYCVVAHFLDTASFADNCLAIEGTFGRTVYTVEPEIEQCFVAHYRAVQTERHRIAFPLADEGGHVRNFAVVTTGPRSAWKWSAEEPSSSAAAAAEASVKDKSRRPLGPVVGSWSRFSPPAFQYTVSAAPDVVRRCSDARKAGGKRRLRDALNALANTPLYKESDGMTPGELCAVLECVLRINQLRLGSKHTFFWTPAESVVVDKEWTAVSAASSVPDSVATTQNNIKIFVRV